MKIDEFINKFQNAKLIGENSYQCICPAHLDKKASLTITADGNKILMHCHAGCDLNSILTSVGLTEKDLFNNEQEFEKPVIEKEYLYTKEDGTPCFKVVRMRPKNFFQNRYKDGQWLKTMISAEYVLYNLPNVAKSEVVYFVEGEKDADNLNNIGLVATTSVGGASGFNKHKDEYIKYLQNKIIYIIPDNDNPGHKYANTIKDSLVGIAKVTKILDLTNVIENFKEKGDISDVILEYGKEKTLEMLEKLKSFDYIEKREFPIHCIDELNEETFSQILDYLGITLKFNIITKKITIQGMPSKFATSDLFNVLAIYLKDVLRNKGIKVTNTKLIDEFITLELSKNHFNPVLETLEKNTWDGKDRITEIYNILNIQDDLDKELIKKWLYQTIAILFNSLEKPFGAEGVLTLQGKQGIGKSRFFSLLAMNPEWYADGVSIDMNNKDSIIKATSRWIVELGELDSTVKKEQNSLKAFITSPEDDIRPPYGKTSIRRARNTSFCATVNPQEFLKDSTGNRRFWVIPVEKIDYQKLENYGDEWILQLWLQVYAELKEYEKLHGDFKIFRLTPSERSQVEASNLSYTEFLPYEEDLLQKFNFDNSIPNEWTSSELISSFFEKASPSQLGKAINKIKNSYPNLVSIKRNRHRKCLYIANRKKV